MQAFYRTTAYDANVLIFLYLGITPIYTSTLDGRLSGSRLKRERFYSDASIL